MQSFIDTIVSVVHTTVKNPPRPAEVPPHSLNMDWIILHTAIGVVLYFLARRLWWLVAPTAYRRQTAHKRHRFDLYLLSLVNATWITSYFIFLMLSKPYEGTSRIWVSMCYLNSYFIHDFIATRREWLQHPADLLHHVLALMIIPFTLRFRSIPHAIPYYGVAELSTIFLDIGWLTRALTGELPSWLQKAFVMSFFPIRVLWFPILTMVQEIMQDPTYMAIGYPGFLVFRLTFFIFSSLVFKDGLYCGVSAVYNSIGL